MQKNLYEAHRQWAVRPPDERFGTMEKLLSFTGERKRESIEDVRPLKGLRMYATNGGALTLNGHMTPSFLTNWAFSQLCQDISAPAGYLRTLPPEMTAACLEYGISRRGQESKILSRRLSSLVEGKAQNMVSAFTSPAYGRIWDHDVAGVLSEAIKDSSWHTPPSKSPEDSGLYASDRDMFIFMVSDEEPVEVGNARLGKGFFLWNSETGSASFGLTTFLFNFVCGNHIVWGAEEVRELRIIHRNRAFNRFYQEAIPVLNRFVENRQLDDAIKDSIGEAMRTQIGNTLDEILQWFDRKPFTRSEITRAWESGISEGEDVRTLWGLVQGMTASVRNEPHMDRRVSLERRAGALLN